MSSGDEAGSDTPAKREPDALDMWFARQRRKWWKQWRWVFYAALMLLAVWSLLETAGFIWVANEWHPSSAQPPGWWAYVEYIVFKMWIIYVWQSLPYMVLGLALLLGTSAAKAAALPPEMAIAYQNEHVFRALFRYTRQQLWLFVGILYTGPGLILGIIFVKVMYGSPAQSDFGMTFLNKVTAIIAISVLAIEGQAGVLRRTAASARFAWILLCPFLLVLFADYISGLLDSFFWQYWFETIPRFSIQMGLWICLLAISYLFSLTWRKPPAGFVGTSSQ